MLIAPVTVDDFVAVNLARQKMPRKSTWFTPKARAGLVLADLAADLTPPAVALGVAAACFLGVAVIQRVHDCVSRFKTRVRGLEHSLPGPRWRYRRRPAGRLGCRRRG